MFEFAPLDWNIRKLGDFATLVNKKFSEEIDAPILSMTKYRGFVKSLEYFNKQVFSNDISNYKLVKKGNFAYATIHLDEGSIGLLKDFQNGYISPMYTVFQIDSTIDGDYLILLMKTKSYLYKYKALAEGTVDRRRSVKFSELSKLNIPLPTLPEQQKIATIISNIDNLITNTQEIIAQTKSLKKGLMQKLLTKGIGHTKFKKVKWLFGKEIEIPKNWISKKVEDVFKLKSGSTPSRTKPEFFEGDISWVTSTDLNRSKIISTIEKITKDAVKDANLTILSKGTFVIATYGLEASGTRGKCGILEINATCNQACMAFLPSSEMNSLFLFYFYLYFGEKIIFSIAQGTKQQNLYSDTVKKVTLLIPPLKEQQKIISILSNIDSQIQSQIQYKEKLERLKKSLMQKLLTGEVRVLA